MIIIENSHAPTSERYFQPGTVMNRVFQEAPYFPRCSDDKTAKWQRPREYAVRLPYMQINRRGFVSWLIFDLDHNQPWSWDDAGLPAPNLIVQNRANGHSHLYYAIVPVCTTAAARSKPIAYMKAIYTAMAVRMNADVDYHSGPVSKTPGHALWKTSELHGHVYELSELADSVELETARPFGKPANIEDISHSRHMMLFEFVRQYAYGIVNRERENGNFATFQRLVEAFAHHKNNFARLGFSENLSLSSIRATVKSVTRWTWENYTGTSRCQRGVMRLSDDLPIPVRQQLAAERTHEVRRQTTEAKIRAACAVLRARCEAVTQLAVAKLAKLTRQTVAAYKSALIEPAPALAPHSLTSLSDVKFAAHQVTGGLGIVLCPGAVVDLPMNLFDDSGGG